jgi:hypothetical protein
MLKMHNISFIEYFIFKQLKGNILSKHIFSLFFVIVFTVNGFASVEIPATDGQVRKFREEFAEDIRRQGCYYDAIGILKFINEQVNKSQIDEDVAQRLGAISCGELSETRGLIRIAEAVRLGYGFDLGVCSHLTVSSAEMGIYRTSLTGIGKRISKSSRHAEAKHIFSKQASTGAIEEHLKLSNALMYNANEDTARVKFVYTPASLVCDKELEARLTVTDEQIRTNVENGLSFLATFATEIPLPTAADVEVKQILFLERMAEPDAQETVRTLYAQSAEKNPTERLENAVKPFLSTSIPENVTNKEMAQKLLMVLPERIRNFFQALESLGFSPECAFFYYEGREIPASFFLEFLKAAAFLDTLSDTQKMKFFSRIQLFASLDFRPDANPLNFSEEDIELIKALKEADHEIIDERFVASVNITPQARLLLGMSGKDGIMVIDTLAKRAEPLTEIDYETIATIIGAQSEQKVWTTKALLNFSSDKLQQAHDLYSAGVPLANYFVVSALKSRLAPLTPSEVAMIASIVGGRRGEVEKEWTTKALLNFSSDKLQQAHDLYSAGVPLANYFVVSALKSRLAPLTPSEVAMIASIVGGRRGEVEKDSMASDLLKLSSDKLQQAHDLYSAGAILGWASAEILAKARDLTPADIQAIRDRVANHSNSVNDVLREYESAATTAVA